MSVFTRWKQRGVIKESNQPALFAATHQRLFTAPAAISMQKNDFAARLYEHIPSMY